MLSNVYERDTLNRIIGMNYEIAMHDHESDRYSNGRIVSFVIAGVI